VVSADAGVGVLVNSTRAQATETAAARGADDVEHARGYIDPDQWLRGQLAG
jgi:hypothetical protein